LLAGFESFNVQQAFVWCTAFSAIACAAAAVRVRLLPASREYRLFFWLLVSWFGICVFTLQVPLASYLYFYIFLVIVPLSWILYFCTARHLYQRVFSKYPGIAFAGRSSMWMAVIGVTITVALNARLSPVSLGKNRLYATVITLDRWVLFGIAFFLVLLVSVMVRYPISLPRNIAVHSFFFASILFFQTVFQVADQWTRYHYSTFCNTLAAAFDALLVTAWALMLTNAGDNAIIRIRRRIRPETEIQLLGQLDTLNGILLRAARK
jgi:hypothetical protein